MLPLEVFSVQVSTGSGVVASRWDLRIRNELTENAKLGGGFLKASFTNNEDNFIVFTKQMEGNIRPQFYMTWGVTDKKVYEKEEIHVLQPIFWALFTTTDEAHNDWFAWEFRSTQRHRQHKGRLVLR
jgi:hypothetical protein